MDHAGGSCHGANAAVGTAVPVPWASVPCCRLANLCCSLNRDLKWGFVVGEQLWKGSSWLFWYLAHTEVFPSHFPAGIPLPTGLVKARDLFGAGGPRRGGW